MFARNRADRTGPRAKREYRAPKAAIDEPMAKQIIAMRMAGMSNATIQIETGVAYDVVSGVANGKTWRFLHGKDGVPSTDEIRSAKTKYIRRR
jgi:hypothetical protein